MCFENVNTKEDLIKEIENLEDVEANLLIEACKKNKDINEFISQVATIKANLSNLKEQLKNEIEERKEEITKIVNSYTMQLNQLDQELSHLYSKFNGFTGEVYKKFEETKKEICNLKVEMVDMKNQLSTEFIKGINKLLITIISSGILIILGYILNHFFGWIK